MGDKNTIKVYTSSSGAELSISAPSTKQLISATNNKAQYFAEQAKKYRDEAKLHRDNAKYYAEQNSDVTFEYINGVQSSLEGLIATKQDIGNYALKEELPVNVSELVNDSKFVNETELDEVRLPNQEGCSGKVLMSDGESEHWAGINTFNLFDTKFSDSILEGADSLGWALQGTYVSKAIYPDFYAKCLEEKNAATATEINLAGSIVTVYKHSKGHNFYDIADKAIIDNFYNVMGCAWFYGVDTENERVFLPRNDYFEQATNDTTKIGHTIAAGLPNITGQIRLPRDSSLDGASGALSIGYYTSNVCRYQWQTTDFGGGIINIDASKSNPIYNNSDTVQPPAVKKLLYICVGNTTVNEALVDIGQLSSDLQYKTDKTEVDGQWVAKVLGLVESKLTMGTYTYNLSSYLPDDGYDYEVMFMLYVNSAQTTHFDVRTPVGLFMRGTTTAEGAIVNLFGIFPIDTSRQVIVEVTNTDVKSHSTLYARGYRRIGTNL